MSDNDQTIHCKDCKTDFVFTESEQKFYADKGFQTPKRCKPCRDLRKSQSNQTPVQTEQQYAPSDDGYSSARGHRKGGRRDNNY